MNRGSNPSKNMDRSQQMPREFTAEPMTNNAEMVAAGAEEHLIYADNSDMDALEIYKKLKGVSKIDAAISGSEKEHAVDGVLLDAREALSVLWKNHFDLADLENSDLTDDEKTDIVAARILARYRHAFEELAK